ncbi:MAG: hypothetical protein AAF982_02965 [Pseudomonadota bacterium]
MTGLARFVPIVKVSFKAIFDDRSLACLSKIDEFGRELLASTSRHVGSRGRIETYTEIVPVQQPSDLKDRSDGPIVLRIGTREWRAFVEAGVGTSELDPDRVERYRILTRENDVDCMMKGGFRFY